MDEQERIAVRRCACANIRRVDRAITQFFDKLLAPGNLHITQFTLLATITIASPITIQRLAEMMVMDRTTLTRNLEPLTRQGLVRVEMGEDRRTRVVQITQAGEEAVEKALPYWQEAQNRVIQMLGEKRFELLLSELSDVVTLVSQ
jgi:DNA-binding MarR family transcriptional regulator